MTTRARLGRGLTLTHLAWFVPLVAIGIAIRRPTQDNSYLWHIEAGIRQLDQGSVLVSDPFTFTAEGTPWRTQSWLIELLYGWMESLSPLASAEVIVGFSAAVLIAAVGLRLGPGRGVLAPLGTLWVLWITLGYFTARPVFPSLALFAVTVLVCSRPRLRWTLPALFWVWASIHGGFIVGLGYVVLDGLRSRDRRRLVDVGASTVAATLGAHGVGIWAILLDFAGSRENLDLISEWRPPDLVSLPFLPFLGGIVALLVLATLQRVERKDLWVIVPFLVFAFTANRAVPLSAIALAAFVFPRNELTLGSKPFARPVGYLVVMLIVVVSLVVPVDEGRFDERFPVEAMGHLEPVRTFHDDGAGGYLIYAGFPEVFIDDRAELFGELYGRFIDTRNGRPGWEDLFGEWELEQALLRGDEPLLELLQANGWARTYSDDSFLVLRP